MNSLANHIRNRRQISFSFFAISVLALSSLSAQQTKPTPQKAVERSKKAAAVLEHAMSNASERIPRALLDKVVAIAVVPDVKQAGLLIESLGTGRGVVSRRGADGGWGPPAFIRLAAMSIGPQIKSNSFDVIMLFMNDRAAGWLVNDKAVMFDRAKAPVAGPVGEIRAEDNQVIPVADIFSYTVDDGRLQGKDLKNVFKQFDFSFDNDLNQATYGVKARALLAADKSGPSRIPSEVIVFPDAVTRLFAGNH